MNLTSHLVNQPWAITADGFKVMLADSAPAAAMPRRPAGAGSSRAGSIAVLPLFGTLSQRMNPFSDFAGYTSLDAFGAVFNQLLNDPSVSSIVLDVDSPGGTVYGVDELGAAIFAARGKKRIAAIANSQAASAAYWICTAANELSVTPSGLVGSIGILAIHEDCSRAEEAAGLRTTLISAGKFKTEGNEHEPLKDTAREALQERVSSYYRMFVRAVARHRGASYADVHEGFGEGRVVGADAALKMGMVDRVETIDQLLERLASTPNSARIPRARAERDCDFESSEARRTQLRIKDALRRDEAEEEGDDE
jgi:signal peptide peptidase SppA